MRKFNIFSIFCCALISVLSGINITKNIINYPVLLESVNLEVGTKQINLSKFYKDGRINNNSKFLTDVNSLDLEIVGSYSIKILENNKEKTIKLNVVDTTPPKVEFKDINRGLNYDINADDFIELVDDYSDTLAEVKNAPEITDDVRYEHLQGRDWDRSNWPAAV